MKNPNSPNQRGINIDLNDEVWEGVYSNFVMATNSPAEFILDFGRGMPGRNKIKVKSRIIMNPQSFKGMVKQFEHALKQYEEQFGEIKLPSKDGHNNYGIGFMKDNDK